MLQIQRLLIPIDFSPSSVLALEQGAALAESHGAQIDLLHVWKVPSFVAPHEVTDEEGFDPTILDAISKSSHRFTERFVLEARAKGIAIHRARTLPGRSLYEKILSEAERGHYDMIVVGSHGRSGLARLGLGSVAERIVRHARCPVLVAHAQPTAAPVHRKRILVPVDFSSSSQLAVEQAGVVARDIGAEIDLLHVWELPTLPDAQDALLGVVLPPVAIDALRNHAASALERFATDAQAQHIPIRDARAVPGSPHELILEQAIQGNYAMIVLGTQGRMGVSRALLGSVAEQVVRQARCPVLVARAQRERATVSTAKTNPVLGSLRRVSSQG